MKKEKDTGFDRMEALNLGKDIADYIANRFNDTKDTLGYTAQMYAIFHAVQPFLLVFGEALTGPDGEDPVPKFLELIKQRYLEVKDRPEVRMVFQNKDLN